MYQVIKSSSRIKLVRRSWLCANRLIDRLLDGLVAASGRIGFSSCVFDCFRSGRCALRAPLYSCLASSCAMLPNLLSKNEDKTYACGIELEAANYIKNLLDGANGDHKMGDRGATGGAWVARDEASWWQGSAGELQHQQIADGVPRSTAAATHQLFTYKMTSGFSNNASDGSTPAYDYRLMSGSSSREDNSPQQPWWYTSPSVEAHQQNTSPTVWSAQYLSVYT
ncbi:hypothetical protein EVAR_64798_1 [Eumeta japonica]|uniref:Uncharacterized protein n=1 Tax=Eumeta variegata TaxID=151549 RepID=A0A4C1ZSK6_EUMVA|nr:hypothetical protein EVAR_64798_1 [Eumeta japonica]